MLAEPFKGIAKPPAPTQHTAKVFVQLEGRRDRILESGADSLIAAIDRALLAARVTTTVWHPAIDQVEEHDP